MRTWRDFWDEVGRDLKRLGMICAALIAYGLIAGGVYIIAHFVHKYW